MESNRLGKGCGSLRTSVLKSGGIEEFSLIARPEGRKPAGMFDAAADALSGLKARVVSQNLFGLKKKGFREVLSGAFGTPGWPVTWMEEGIGDPPCAGMQIHAVAGCEVRRLQTGREINAGVLYEDEYAGYCHAGNITPGNINACRTAQAREVLEQMGLVLEKAGMGYKNLVRTWFFIDDILSWYDGFNRVREDFFREVDMLDSWLPASTGIGAKNSEGAAVCAGFIALKPKTAGVEVLDIPSPLQSPPSSYGSFFSRAAEVHTPSSRRLYVSGTASINRSGETVYIGSPLKQISFTMEVVERILVARRMGWNDVSRATAYFKKPEFIPLFFETAGMLGLPVLLVRADICRDNLLFEIEVDAVKKTGEEVSSPIPG